MLILDVSTELSPYQHYNQPVIVTRNLVGCKEERNAPLEFLHGHIIYDVDFQGRMKWEEATVVVWDNSHRTYASCRLDKWPAWACGQKDISG